MSYSLNPIQELTLDEKRALLARLLQHKASQPKIFPLSFAQERLWFLDQFEPNSPLYNIPVTVQLPAHLDERALKRSLSEIARRHEVLRTTFAVVEGHPVQVIHEAVQLPLKVIDLRHLREAERRDEVERLQGEEARTSFDLRRGPLMRSLLVRLGGAGNLLLLTMHHMISDGWSMGILFRELSTLYEVYSRQRPSPFVELPIQYADFALWQREMLSGATLERLLSYWRTQLRGAPPVLELPSDRPRLAVQSFRGSLVTFRLGRKLTEGLKELTRSEGVTLFMVLLAGFKVLLMRYSGQKDIVVGTPIANRNRAEIEGLIGFFVNTLVLRTSLEGDPSFRQLLKRVREVTLGAYEHQDLPFERLVEELHPERTLSHSTLVQVVFALQNIPTWGDSGSDTPEENADPSDAPQMMTGTSKFDLTVSIGEMGRILMGGFEYNTDLYDSTTIKRMIEHFLTLLESAVADPDQRLSSLRLLTNEETAGYTPSDFPDAALNQKDFEDLMEELNQLSNLK